MSDPFENIGNEVYLDKLKSFFYKFKLLIILSISLIMFIIIGFTYYNSIKKKELTKISDYYIKILSIIDTNPEKAKIELQKLEKLKDENYKNLSNLLVFKLQFEKNELYDSINSLKKIEKNVKSGSPIDKILKYYYAQVYLEQNNKEKFEKYIGELLSFGGMWALLAYELRGHLYYSAQDYSASLKNFHKIINNQQASVSIKNRAQEMIDNIKLYYGKDS